MNIKQCIYLFAAIAFSLSSCSDDSGMGNDFEPKTYNVLKFPTPNKEDGK